MICAGTRRKQIRRRSSLAIRLTDLSLMFISAAIWRVLRCVSVAPSCEQISSSTRSMFGAVRTDFGRPQPALHSAAYPIVLMWRQIFCTVLNFHSLYGYARIIAFAPHPCSRSVCILILSACDTFPILTALTKCWLLTAILPKYRVLYLHIHLPDEFASLQRHFLRFFYAVLSFFVSNNKCYNQKRKHKILRL